jgi:phospholipase A2
MKLTNSLIILSLLLGINNSYADWLKDLKDQASKQAEQAEALALQKKQEIEALLKEQERQALQKKQDIEALVQEQENKVKEYFSNNASTKDVEIRRDSAIPESEKQLIEKRLATNNIALEQILGKKLEANNNLKIAFCASGGGYRALTATLGSMRGAEQINLLNAATYMAGLSGGAWAFGAWASSDKSINAFTDMVKQNLARNPKYNTKYQDITIPDIQDSQVQYIIKNLFDLYVSGLPLTSVDLWGAAITDNLLNPIANRHQLKLTDQQNLISDKPFPIYTAVQPVSSLKYNWFEFTPFEVGNLSSNFYIPTWGFGRKFLNGKSVGSSPELPLDLYLGIFGSAFTVSPEELVNKMNLKVKVIQYLHDKFPLISTENLDKILDIQSLFKELENKNVPVQQIISQRFIPALVANPNLGLQGDNQKNIVLVDGGIDFNLPLPPLLRPERNVDIIFVLDASESVAGGEELKAAEIYAAKNNLKFPKIDYSNIDKSAVNIFGLEESDPTVPVIIYMPRINALLNMSETEIENAKAKLTKEDAQLIDKLKKFDPEECAQTNFCSTFNFAYTTEQFDLLSSMTYLNMVINKDKIHDAIKSAFNRKYTATI